jgi:hypothetical protein
MRPRSAADESRCLSVDTTSSGASRAVAAFAILVLVACGGGGGGSSMPPTYTIGGTVAGLGGSGLALGHNGAYDLSLV